MPAVSVTIDTDLGRIRPHMHVACLCPPYPSHIRAMGALARGLIARGHRITFALPEGVQADVPCACLRIGPKPRSLGSLGGALGQSFRQTDALCTAVERFRGVDAILGDQMEPASGLIAAHLGVPLISVACALPLEREPEIPLPFLGWPYDPSRRGLRRNAGGVRIASWILHRQNRMLRDWSDRLGVPPVNDMESCLSPILTISQTLPGFEYPRRSGTVVETGLLRDGAGMGQGVVPATEEPFVYASLGTLQGHREGLLRTIVAGCHRAGMRVMVSHGGALSDVQAAALGADWTCAYAPQEAALDRAALCITHGGLNTAMEALERQVPMVVIPLAFDQFGVAARIAWHGAGLRLSRHFLTATRVARAVERVMHDPTFARNAARFASGPGVPHAVRLIEERLIRHRISA